MQSDEIKIDAYNHYLPPAYIELLKTHAKDSGIVKRMTSIRVLWDIEARVDMLAQWPEVRQVLTLGLPHPEGLGAPEISIAGARAAMTASPKPAAAGPTNSRPSSRRCR